MTIVFFYLQVKINLFLHTFITEFILSGPGQNIKTPCVNLPLRIVSSLPSLVTVCPCNVRGNCKMPVKQLQGMPTIQSAVGILLGTFALIGKKMEEMSNLKCHHYNPHNIKMHVMHSAICRIKKSLLCVHVDFLFVCFSLSGTILVVVFVRLSYQNPKEPIKSNQETVPLKIAIWDRAVFPVLFTQQLDQVTHLNCQKSPWNHCERQLQIYLPAKGAGGCLSQRKLNF